MHFFLYFFGGLECAGYSFADIAHFVLLEDVWIRTQRAAVASRCATNLAKPTISLSPPISQHLTVTVIQIIVEKGRFYIKGHRRGRGGAQRLGQNARVALGI